MLFLLSKEKIKLAILWWIQIVVYLIESNLYSILGYFDAFTSEYVVRMNRNFQRRCSHLSRNICIKIRTTEEFLHWSPSSGKHCFKKDLYLPNIATFYPLTSVNKVQLTRNIHGSWSMYCGESVKGRFL